MNYESTPIVTQTVSSPSARWTLPSLCWGAIIGGTVAAIGIHILLSVLGVGAGLATFSPMSDAEPVKAFSQDAAAIWSACALAALFFGGVIAGRFSESLHNGLVHGILVWCLTLIITLVLLSMGTGMVLGGALKVLGEGAGIAGKAVAGGAGDIVKEVTQRTGDETQSFIQEAVQSMPTNTAPNVTTRAKREIGFAVTRLFASGNDITSQTNRAAVIKALVDNTQVSQEEATKTVDGWLASYNNLKVELDNLKAAAAEKAKVAADESAKNLSTAGIWLFFGLLIGLLVSAGGGVLGADFAVRRIKLNNRTVVAPAN